MSSAIKQSVWPVDMDVAADLTSEPVEQRLWRDRSQVSVGHGELVVMKRLIIASVLALLVSGVTAEARGFGGGGFRGGAASMAPEWVATVAAFMGTAVP